MNLCPLECSTTTSNTRFDSVVIVTDSVDKLTGHLANLQTVVSDYLEIDPSTASSVGLIVTDTIPSNRLIYSPTGPLDRDQDDVRSIYDAASAGIKRAIAAGSTMPLLVRPADDSFAEADLCALLGALHAVYVPLEVREAIPGQATKVSLIGWYTPAVTAEVASMLARASGLEAGRYVSRDIGGSDPERMAPPRVTEYVEDLFRGTSISVSVMEGQDTFVAEFPLLAAVNRACKDIDRHQGRVIWLTYEGTGTITETLMLVGKGICYDTGGADIKAGGVMAGMHRDKCGAASVAGFFKTLDSLRPTDLKVVGAMCVVRNSVGSECYVSDEIITSRAGIRVRVGNTDAEGRMVMTDVLCEMKERAANEVNPTLSTWATLTGHAVLTYGGNYSAVMGNGPACNVKIPQRLIQNGLDMADPLELSTIRREDYEFVKPPSEYEDVIQSNTAPSSSTQRGHQFPPAFMMIASGLDQHGKNAAEPLKYVHIDLSSSGPFPGVPTGTPILAFAKTYIPQRI